MSEKAYAQSSYSPTFARRYSGPIPVLVAHDNRTGSQSEDMPNGKGDYWDQRLERSTLHSLPMHRV